MDIYISINTNHEFGETKIEDGAIHEFTTNGFIEGTYDARVEFSCLPAAVDSNALAVAIEYVKDIADYGELIVFYVGVCKAVYKFLKKCHGFSKTIDIEGVEEIAETIVMTDDMTEEEFEARVIAILELERKNIGRDVAKMMENEKI